MNKIFLLVNDGSNNLKSFMFDNDYLYISNTHQTIIETFKNNSLLYLEKSFYGTYKIPNENITKIHILDENLSEVHLFIDTALVENKKIPLKFQEKYPQNFIDNLNLIQNSQSLSFLKKIKLCSIEIFLALSIIYLTGYMYSDAKMLEIGKSIDNIGNYKIKIFTTITTILTENFGAKSILVLGSTLFLVAMGYIVKKINSLSKEIFYIKPAN